KRLLERSFDLQRRKVPPVDDQYFLAAAGDKQFAAPQVPEIAGAEETVALETVAVVAEITVNHALAAKLDFADHAIGDVAACCVDNAQLVPRNGASAADDRNRTCRALVPGQDGLAWGASCSIDLLCPERLHGGRQSHRERCFRQTVDWP